MPGKRPSKGKILRPKILGHPKGVVPLVRSRHGGTIPESILRQAVADVAKRINVLRRGLGRMEKERPSEAKRLRAGFLRDIRAIITKAKYLEEICLSPERRAIIKNMKPSGEPETLKDIKYYEAVQYVAAERLEELKRELGNKK